MSKNADEYLFKVLKKYALKNWDSDKVKEKLSPLIKEWGGNNINDLFVMGSFAKGTGILGLGDIDFFISIDNRINLSLKELYDRLYSFLEEKNFSPRKQNVSIRINWNTIDLDLVPGRTEGEHRNYHSLFSNRKQSWIETNVKAQIGLILNSNRINEIKCLKIWKKIHGLTFPSYYLELAVLKALKGNKYDQISLNLWHLLKYLNQDFATDKIEDPIKPSNMVSDTLNSTERSNIANTAAASLTKKNWEDIIW